RTRTTRETPPTSSSHLHPRKSPSSHITCRSTFTPHLTEYSNCRKQASNGYIKSLTTPLKL
ncbi:hypothetical protein COCHEDRAFT_1020374, partial [Bipolaris maydis C5]